MATFIVTLILATSLLNKLLFTDLVMQSIPVFFAVLDPSMLELIQGAACTTLGFKISLPITGRHRCVQLQDVEAPRISRKSAREEGYVVTPTHRPPYAPR
jgi:hypothetical protein